jgi:DNA-binding NarL/FixJ family response regulator
MESICRTTAKTIRILLVDDTGSVRRALRLILGVEADLDVVGEAPDGLHAVALAAALRPDIVLIDHELPGISGIEAARRIRAAGSAGGIIMLTAFGGDEARAAASGVGIALFLEKGDDLDDLAERIRSVHERNILH